LQKPLSDNTQHSQDTDIHAPGGIRTPNRSKQAAADHTQDCMTTICYSIHIHFITQCVPKQHKKNTNVKTHGAKQTFPSSQSL
jgi:hypothetical protein